MDPAEQLGRAERLLPELPAESVQPLAVEIEQVAHDDRAPPLRAQRL